MSVITQANVTFPVGMSRRVATGADRERAGSGDRAAKRAGRWRTSDRKVEREDGWRRVRSENRGEP